MDKRALELSRHGLEIFAKEISPEYEKVRAALLGRLSASSATAEALVAKEINDQNNVKLLKDFVSLLPKTDITSRLVTLDPFLIRMFQSSVIWVHATPCYVLGYRTQKKEYELLLAAAQRESVKDSVPKISVAQMDNAQKTALQRLQEHEASKFPSPEESKELFDPSYLAYAVNYLSVGSTRVSLKFLPQPIDKLSDEDMAQFDVNSSLHRLATRFSVVEELNSLLSQESNSN